MKDCMLLNDILVFAHKHPVYRIEGRYLFLATAIDFCINAFGVTAQEALDYIHNLPIDRETVNVPEGVRVK